MRQTNWDTSISAPDVSEVKIGNLCSIFGGPCQLFDLFSPPSLAVDIDAIVEFDELPRGVHKVKCDFLSISESRIHVPHPNFHDLALYVRSTTTTSFLPGAFQIERRSYFCSPIERPDRKIIQQRNNCPKIIKITKFIKWRKEIFSYCFLIKLSQSSSKKERAKKVPSSPSINLP